MARKIKDLAYFIGMLKFKDTNPNGIAKKIVERIETEFRLDLFEKKLNN